MEHYRKAGSRVVLLGDHSGNSLDAVSEDSTGNISNTASGSRPAGAAATTVFLFKGLRRVVRSFRPDVAHVQYMAPGAIPIIILRLLGIRKVLATAHTAGDIYPSLRLVRFLQRRLLTAFTCITERAECSFFGSSLLFDKETVLTKKGNHFTIWNCLPDHIEPTSGRTEQSFGQNAETQQNTKAQMKQTPPEDGAARPLTLGVVSRLEEIKGTDLVVPAFAKVYARMPGTRLLIVGDGSQRTLMERQTAEAGLKGCVEFAGRQTQEHLQDYYDRIDILLIPSRSEGFGLTAIEGMARGCVPVVSNVGGLPEVVTDGKTGLLHRPEDAEDIATKVLTLLDDRKRLSRMSAAAAGRAALFSTDRYGRLITALYSKIALL